MSVCGYVYDANGLRWEEGFLTVRLLVDDEPKTLVVVRSGQGTSRVDRFEGSSHFLDGQVDGGRVSGEISVRDLEALTFGSPVGVVRNGKRCLVRVPDDLRDIHQGRVRGERLFPASAFHPADGRLSRFDVGFLPSRSQGEAGRQFDEASVRAFVEGLSGDERRVLAAAQVASMPKSGRAGGPMSRLRLRFFAGELPVSGLVDAMEANPDALLHVTPGLVADLAGRGDDESRAFGSFVERALSGPSSEGGTVLFASLYAHAAAGGDAFGVDVDLLRSRLVDRLAVDVSTGTGDLFALEILSTADRGSVAGPSSSRALAADVLRAALVRGPGRALSPSMGIFLARLHDNAAPDLLELLLEERPAQIVCTPDFFAVLPVEVRLDAVRREPRLALERLELDHSAEEIAVNELRRRDEPVPMTRSEAVLARRRNHVDAIRESVNKTFADLAEFESVFTDRLLRIRQVRADSLERERLLAYGGLSTSLREYFWPALRTIQDLATQVEMLEFEVRSPFRSPAGYIDASSRRLLADLAEVPSALDALRTTVRDAADRLESLRALARDGLVGDFCVEAKQAFDDVPVAVHRHLNVVLAAVARAEVLG